jgi:hypothetical protein
MVNIHEKRTDQEFAEKLPGKPYFSLLRVGSRSLVLGLEPFDGSEHPISGICTVRSA